MIAAALIANADLLLAGVLRSSRRLESGGAAS
jgi:hypothetical protein